MDSLKAIYLHDKKEIEPFLRRNVYLHIYGIGDLDDFFWPYTTWYAWKEDKEIQAIALLYSGRTFPVFVALSETDSMKHLVQSILHLLPCRFHAHLSPGVEATLEEKYKMKSHGKHYKMALSDKSSLYDIDCSQVIHLQSNDLDEILQLYKEGYPGNWFDTRMLETKQYFGIRRENRLVSIAGIHVYSEKYKVAALGNIVTHPDYRSDGLGKSVTAKLCQSLSKQVDHIGLNVKSDNEIAISMYKRLGFEIIGSYWEYTVESK
jgi:ribosomal protein S18 acetylase RimI-like enzyme